MLFQTKSSTFVGATIVWTRMQTAILTDPIALAHTLMADAFATICTIVRTIADVKFGLKSIKNIVCVAIQ